MATDNDLDEELKQLGIKDDFGDEDSDVTPTNTPPVPSTAIYMQKYPSSKTSGFCEGYEFGWYAQSDDSENRSESSLSWGEDEFEGEATRIVSALFDQLDSTLYDETPVQPVIPCVFPEGQQADSNIHQRSNKGGPNESLQIEHHAEYYDIKAEGPSPLGPITTSEPHRKISLQPSQELQDECSTWVKHFPHFRVRGYAVDPKGLEEVENLVYPGAHEISQQNDEQNEGLIALDGDFYDLLPFVSLVSPKPPNQRSKEQKKQVPPSRVCSGSSDPDVLKEQLLISLFNKLWPLVSETVAPLLYQYATYIIEQSVQYSSLSREPSSDGARYVTQACHDHIELSGTVRQNSRERHLSIENVSRPGTNLFRGQRPTSAMSRPKSANKLYIDRVPTQNVNYSEFQDLLQITSKPLQNGEEKLQLRSTSATRSRGSSAQSLASVSLPSVPTPRTVVQRPISSQAANHLLTPMPTTEQRPASSSSYTRRFHNKFQQLSLTGTIREDRGGDGCDDENDDERGVPSTPTWSRHVGPSFLPPICDTFSSGSISKQQLHSPSTAEVEQQHGLSVRGTSVPAWHKSSISKPLQIHKSLGVTLPKKKKVRSGAP